MNIPRQTKDTPGSWNTLEMGPHGKDSDMPAQTRAGAGAGAGEPVAQVHDVPQTHSPELQLAIAQHELAETKAQRDELVAIVRAYRAAYPLDTIDDMARAAIARAEKGAQ